jgi:hypothetical protein
MEAIPIGKLRKTDVLFGNRNSKKKFHKGNRLYDTIIDVHKWQYCVATPGRKHKIATSIHKYYIKQKYRFLEKQIGTDSCYVITNNEDAINKIKASLNNGAVARKKELQDEILAKAYRTRTIATINIEIPHDLLQQILSSKFVFDENNVRNTLIEHDNEVEIRYYASLVLPFKHTTKATLSVHSSRKKARVDNETKVPTVDHNNVFDELLVPMECETILHSMSTDRQNIDYYSELVNDHNSFNTASMLRSMNSDHGSATIYEKLVTKKVMPPVPRKLECQTNDPDDDQAQIDELLRLMKEDDDDFIEDVEDDKYSEEVDIPMCESKTMENDSSHTVSFQISNNDFEELSSKLSTLSIRGAKWLQESIGSFSVDMVRTNICFQQIKV